MRSLNEIVLLACTMYSINLITARAWTCRHSVNRKKRRNVMTIIEFAGRITYSMWNAVNFNKLIWVESAKMFATTYRIHSITECTDWTGNLSVVNHKVAKEGPQTILCVYMWLWLYEWTCQTSIYLECHRSFVHGISLFEEEMARHRRIY